MNGSGNRWQALFRPAISILNRVSYTKKFTLLWLISLIAITVMAYSLFISMARVIQPSQRQLKGLVLIKPILQTMQTIQLHRGISVSLFGGNEGMRDRHAASEQKAIAAFGAMEEKLPASLTSGKNFQAIKSRWNSLLKEQRNLTVAVNFAEHTALIDDLQALGTSTIDEYSLAMDQELNTFYLIDITVNRLPHAIEHLGQLRAYGTSILSRKHISEQQRRRVSNLIAELDIALKEFNKTLDKAGRYNPAVQKLLAGISNDIAKSAWRMTHIVTSDILAGRFSTSPDAFLGIATAEIDKSYAQIFDTLLPATESLIGARIAQARSTLYTSTGLALLAVLLAVYLSASVYYAIVGNIRSLTRSASAFAGGNLHERAILDTRDELALVGGSFNEMADGFNAMLETHLKDEARLRAIIETSMDAVVQMNAEGIITGWNSPAQKIFGWAHAEVIGRALHETIIPPQHREAHLRGLEHFLLTGEGPILNSRIETMGLHRDGHEFPIELSIGHIDATGQSPDKCEFSAFIRDITRQKESEKLIWNQANFDTLTGLPNRHMFHDRLEQEIKKSNRTGLKAALLFIDLDKFKEVNDTLGHSMGDTLLKEAARRIIGCVRDADTVARLGGDEFTVILAGLDDAESIGRVTENILQSLLKPFRLGEEIAYISASIGITLYPDDATEIEHLIKNADQAMYAAKNKGRNRFDYFTPSMQEAAQIRLKLINELRGALTADQFRIYYQPVLDLDANRINKAEALIRWQHPQLGMVSPAQFVPLAEETGMIIEIGDWIFRESARQLKLWRTMYNPEFQISVNVSPVQIGNTASGAYKAWFRYLHELGLPEQSMVIEITEGLLLEAHDIVTDKLLEFRDAGIQVAIDDFGTGYSALSYLKKFDIDYLKIDRSFVRDMATNPDDRALSEAIIVMAHKLGLKVIAEGVETEEQRRLLVVAGCDYAQGYYFSRPVPAEEFEELLKVQQTESNNYSI